MYESTIIPNALFTHNKLTKQITFQLAEPNSKCLEFTAMKGQMVTGQTKSKT
jgi:hypothetical protein